MKDRSYSHIYIHKIGSQLIYKKLSFISNIILILATGLFQILTNILAFNELNGQASNKDDV